MAEQKKLSKLTEKQLIDRMNKNKAEMKRLQGLVQSSQDNNERTKALETTKELFHEQTAILGVLIRRMARGRSEPSW